MGMDMKGQSCWNWMECIFKRIPIPPAFVSMIVGAAVALIYVLFITEVEGIAWNNYYSLQAIFVASLIIYLLYINQHLLNQMRIIFLSIKFSPARGNGPCKLYSYLEYNFKSRRFFLLLGIVFLPHITIDLLRVFVLQSVEYEVAFFSSPLLNLYTYLITFFAYYLLAYLFWIVINTKRLLDKIAEKPYTDLIKIDLFNADGIGGLGRIKDFIMKLNIYLSLGISLAILAYIDKPDGFSPVVIYDVIILILFLLIGFALLFSALDSLKKIFKKRMIEEITRIDEKHQEKYYKLLEISSDVSKEKDGLDLKFLSDYVDVLHKEREERIKILEDFENKYNLKPTISAFVSFIMPLLALYEKVKGFGINELLSAAFSSTVDSSTMASLWAQLMLIFRFQP